MQHDCQGCLGLPPRRRVEILSLLQRLAPTTGNLASLNGPSSCPHRSPFQGPPENLIDSFLRVLRDSAGIYFFDSELRHDEVVHKWVRCGEPFPRDILVAMLLAR